MKRWIAGLVVVAWATCAAPRTAFPDRRSDLATQLAALQRAIAAADQAMTSGVVCGEVKAELDRWWVVAAHWPAGAAPQLAALSARRKRIDALIQAAMLDGQPSGSDPWRITVPRAIEVAQGLIDGIDRGLRESTCDLRPVGYAQMARGILVALDRPVADAGELNLRAMKLSFLCQLVKQQTGRVPGKIDPAAIRAEAKRALDELAAVPEKSVTAEHKARFARVEDTLVLLTEAGDTGTRALDDERNQIADRFGVRPSMDRIIAQGRAAMRELPPAMKQQFPGASQFEFVPREATQRAKPAVDALDCEAFVLDDAGRMADALSRRDQALASVRATEPGDSPLRLEREVTSAENLSAKHGRHAEAAKRIKDALAAFEATHRSVAPDLAMQLEPDFRKLAAIAQLAQRPDDARRALEAAARYHELAKPMLAMVHRFDITGGLQAIETLQALQDQVARGDHDGARRALEQSDRIDVMRLIMLVDLESEAGNSDAAFAALVDAAEGMEHDTEEIQRLGGAARDAVQPMIPSLVNNLGGIEAQVHRLGPKAAPDRTRSLLFWLTELRKGRFFDALAFGERIATPDGARILAELRQARAESAARYLAHVGERHANTTEDRLRACHDPKPSAPAANQNFAQIHHLEEQLLAHAPAQVWFPAYLSGGRPRAQYPHGSAAKFVADVTAALPAGSRFVGLSRVSEGGPAIMSSPAVAPAASTAKYIGFVVGPSGVTLVELGDAGDIDRVVAQAVAQVSHHPPSDSAAPDPALVAAMQAAYDRLWRPLLPALQGAGHVFIAGDSPLDALPFAALRDGDHWLFERTTLSYLHSARDLLVPRPTGFAGPAVVLADPALPPAPSASSPLQPGKFDPLQYAEPEAEAVHRLLPNSVIKLHADASEVALLSVARPRILHIASHAAFLQDRPTAPPAATAAQRGATIAPVPVPRSALPDEGAEEGWMRSALVLSAPATAPGAKPVWDGFATAYEIMAMDLHGTELVTLSACQTGNGTVIGRHGTTSLQRAFFNAGAQSVLATLWRIDDRTTPEWIRVFYAGLLAGHPRERAVQEAMAAIRARSPHPYFWAAFSLAGAVGPLQALQPRDASGRDASGEVQIVVARGGAPVPRVHTYFVNPDGSLATVTDTDASGTAAATVGVGGSVTVVDPFGAAAPDFHELRTISGVKSGDRLMITDEGPRKIRAVVKAPAVPGVGRYAVVTTCGKGTLSGASVAAGFVELSCAATDVLILAGEDGKPVKSLYHPDVTVADGGTIDLTGDRFQDLVGRRFEYTGLTATRDLLVSTSLITPHGGIETVVRGKVTVAGGRASTTLAQPRGASVGAVTTLIGTPAALHIVMDIGPVAPTYHLDAAGALLPEIVQPRYDAAGHRITWQEAGGAVTADVSSAEIEVTRALPGKPPQRWRWKLVAPHSAGQLELPALPSDVQAWFPQAADQVKIQVLHSKLRGGYDAARAHVFDEPGLAASYLPGRLVWTAASSR